MTCRAIIWCGTIPKSHQGADYDVIDAAMSRNDIELAVHAAHSRGIRPEDIWLLVCNEHLLPMNFEGEVGSADLAALADVSRHLQTIGVPDDGLLFIATNHGDPDGLLTDSDVLDEYSDDSDASRLSPALLRQHLDSIPGQQILIIATCYAGVFLPIASERRAVLAACGADERYKMQARFTPFLYELLRRWAGVNPLNLENYPPRPIAEAFGTAFEIDGQCAHIQGTPRWPDE